MGSQPAEQLGSRSAAYLRELSLPPLQHGFLLAGREKAPRYHQGPREGLQQQKMAWTNDSLRR
jgi:hypothetical protein